MKSDQLLEELSHFPNREQELRKVTRYSLYHTMWYRTNLWGHSRRVAWITEEITPFAQKILGKAFDPDRAVALALVHDDAETIFGDVQAGNKSKMSKEELAEIDQQERDAIEVLASRSPKTVGGYEYASLLHEVVDKETLESMVVTWADKYDGFGEALHEVFAGNTIWTTNVQNEYGTIPLPTQYYIDFFDSFIDKYPASKDMLAAGHPWFSPPKNLDEQTIVSEGSKHSESSIKEVGGYPPYDQWLVLTLKRGNKEDILNLHVPKE